MTIESTHIALEIPTKGDLVGGLAYDREMSQALFLVKGYSNMEVNHKMPTGYRLQREKDTPDSLPVGKPSGRKRGLLLWLP
jgi:hypothetical protein